MTWEDETHLVHRQAPQSWEDFSLGRMIFQKAGDDEKAPLISDEDLEFGARRLVFSGLLLRACPM